MLGFLEDAWDWICDVWEYIISFEWLEDIGDFFSGMFSNLGEFSFFGLFFGIAVIIFIYLLRDYMLDPFLIYMTPITALFWKVVTYIGCGILGYCVGKGILDRD